ncbi:hypothetical protein [Bradyrhizobium sp. 2TAF24]|uniref:hypothetical protein n=1 Tax=Bradyrhizobium sp. 2TAF24 TaxID=3233011 RepID=UPI003F924B4C
MQGNVQAVDAVVARTFATLPALLEAAPRLIARAQLLDVDCWLGPVEQPFLAAIRRGRIVEMTVPSRPMPSWRFGYTATAGAWRAYWETEPKAGWHDLLALTKRGEATLSGDLHPFLCHLQYFKDLLALPRAQMPGRAA